MTDHTLKLLPSPSAVEREHARAAATNLRMAVADPSTMGKRNVAHVDLARPRRGMWHETWVNLPGFARITGRDGRRYIHACLPGWEYRQNEIRTEMIPDLEALAERGERPTQATPAS